MLNFLFRSKRRIEMLCRGVVIACKLIQYKSLHQHRFKAGSSLHFGKDFKILLDDSMSGIEIGELVNFRNYCELRSGANGKLSIGNNNFFNNNCSIQCLEEIKIGNNCQFGEATRMYDMNHNYKEPGKLISEQGYSTGKIIIGNNCWFGSNVTILKNVTIGDNVVIGANCLIHQSIPSNSVVTNQQTLNIRPIG